MGVPKNARAIPLAKATAERGWLAAQANLAEIKAAKLRGELVEAAEVGREWANVLRTVRAVPSRVAARCHICRSTMSPRSTPRSGRR